MTSIAHQVYQWLGLINEGEEVTLQLMRDIVPEGTQGAISSALSAFSLCDPPLIELVARRRVMCAHSSNYVYMYVYRRTDVAVKPDRPEYHVNPVGGKPGRVIPVRHMRGDNLPIEDEPSEEEHHPWPS